MIKLWLTKETIKRQNTNEKTEWDSSPDVLGPPLPLR
ncbi:hypothetical protein HNO89_004006 [Sporosarcina luteola]|nr:hypothetical protein [Sporosarcina luteola]